MDVLYWLLFDAAWWVRFLIVSVCGLAVGAVIGESVRRIFSLEQAPGWVIGLPMFAGLIGVQSLPQVLDPDGKMQAQYIQEISLSDFIETDLPDHYKLVLERDDDARQSFNDALAKINELDLEESEKLKMASQLAFPTLFQSVERYRLSGSSELLRSGLENTHDLVKSLRAADAELCGDYVSSFIGLGSGYDVNELVQAVGVDRINRTGEIDEQLVSDGLSRQLAPISYSPNLEFTLQIDAEAKGFGIDRLTPDFISMSDAQVCDWFIEYTAFQLSQPPGKMSQYLQNDFALGQLGNSIQFGELVWEANYLGSGNGFAWFQIAGTSVNRDDVISFTCTVSEAGPTVHSVYFVDTVPLSGGDVILRNGTSDPIFAVAEIEDQTNLLLNVEYDDPVFELVAKAFSNGDVLTVTRGNLTPLIFDLSGAGDFFDAYISRCEEGLD